MGICRPKMRQRSGSRHVRQTSTGRAPMWLGKQANGGKALGTRVAVRKGQEAPTDSRSDCSAVRRSVRCGQERAGDALKGGGVPALPSKEGQGGTWMNRCDSIRLSVELSRTTCNIWSFKSLLSSKNPPSHLPERYRNSSNTDLDGKLEPHPASRSLQFAGTILITRPPSSPAQTQITQPDQNQTISQLGQPLHAGRILASQLNHTATER